jgi:hypothetical protein
VHEKARDILLTKDLMGQDQGEVMEWGDVPSRNVEAKVDGRPVVELQLVGGRGDEAEDDVRRELEVVENAAEDGLDQAVVVPHTAKDVPVERMVTRTRMAEVDDTWVVRKVLALVVGIDDRPGAFLAMAIEEGRLAKPSNEAAVDP